MTNPTAEAEHMVLITQGWSLIHETEGVRTYTRPKQQSVVIHVLLLLSIIFAVWGNLLYAVSVSGVEVRQVNTGRAIEGPTQTF